MVFDIVELFERIIINLSNDDIIRVRSVNKLWMSNTNKCYFEMIKKEIIKKVEKIKKIEEKITIFEKATSKFVPNYRFGSLKDPILKNFLKASKERKIKYIYNKKKSLNTPIGKLQMIKKIQKYNIKKYKSTLYLGNKKINENIFKKIIKKYLKKNAYNLPHYYFKNNKQSTLGLDTKERSCVRKKCIKWKYTNDFFFYMSHIMDKKESVNCMIYYEKNRMYLMSYLLEIYYLEEKIKTYH